MIPIIATKKIRQKINNKTNSAKKFRCVIEATKANNVAGIE